MNGDGFYVGYCSSMQDPFQIISRRLCHAAVRQAISGQVFWEESPQAYKDALKAVANVPRDKFWARLLELDPSLSKHAEPFFIFPARTSASKKHQVFWILIVNKMVSTFSSVGEKDKKTKEHVRIKGVERQDASTILLRYEDDSKSKLIFDWDNTKLYALLCRYFDEKIPNPNSFRLLLECLQMRKERLPADFIKLNGAILSLFIQPDFFVVRVLVNMRMDIQVKKVLGTALVRIYAYGHSLSYYLSYVTWLYFQDPPPAPELLRGDTILTTSLAGTREVYAHDYLMNLVTEMEKRMPACQSTAEVASAFLDVLERTPIPKVLKFVCWIIFKEAKKAFPDGRGAYNAVSAFFFLRGLFPLITMLERPDNKKKLMAMSSLTNFVVKPEIEPFIPRIQRFINALAVFDVTPADFESNLSAESIKASFASLFEILSEYAEKLIEKMPITRAAGYHPLQWFAYEQLDLTLGKTRGREASKPVIAPPEVRPRPPPSMVKGHPGSMSQPDLSRIKGVPQGGA